MSDRPIMVTLGVMCITGAVLTGLWLEYQHWFIYPEYTQRLFFWKFWNVILGVGACAFAGVWCLERGFRRRRR
jgi:hypothetical protein